MSSFRTGSPLHNGFIRKFDLSQQTISASPGLITTISIVFHPAQVLVYTPVITEWSLSIVDRRR